MYKYLKHERINMYMLFISACRARIWSLLSSLQFAPALGTVLVHVLRTRGGLDHYTTCKLTIDVWCGQILKAWENKYVYVIYISMPSQNMKFVVKSVEQADIFQYHIHIQMTCLLYLIFIYVFKINCKQTTVS
jgi:hypothetical protein